MLALGRSQWLTADLSFEGAKISKIAL